MRPLVVGSALLLAACSQPDRPVPPDRPASRGQTSSAGKHSSQECEALRNRATTKENAFDEAHRACAKSADCVYGPDADCTNRCPTQTAASAAPQRAALAAELNAGECAAFHAGGCDLTTPAAVPSCAMFAPFCKDGRCANERAP